MKNKLVLSLGSNLGNRYAYLRQAIHHIEQSFDTSTTCSRYHTTPPWGETNQAQFINMALYLDTDKSAVECMELLQKIEERMGRVKTKKWGPRSIDIDILFYANSLVTSPELVIPHPYMHERGFVMKPLSDIMPDFMHPVLNKTIAELQIGTLDDTLLFYH
jgi:2-amino-4-hydroxy-6-hydroxymethyldihydropteridine diphosphokinase